MLHVHTGCGKSGIIACLPFVLNPTISRYLIITPASNIRDQIRQETDKKNSENFYHRYGILPQDKPLPSLMPEGPFNSNFNLI